MCDKQPVFRWIVCVFIAVLFWTTAAWSLTTRILETQLSQDLITRFSTLEPGIPTQDMRLSFVNLKTMRIPETAKTVDYDLSIIASILGRTVIPLRFLDEAGELLHKTAAVVEIDAIRPYLRTTRVLRRGMGLVSADVKVVVENMRGKPKNSLHHIEDLQGHEVATYISVGSLLTTSMIQPPPKVRARDMVVVKVQQEHISLEVKGKAMEDGRLGEVIRVKLAFGNGRLIRGEVVGEKKVKLLGPYQ